MTESEEICSLARFAGPTRAKTANTIQSMAKANLNTRVSVVESKKCPRCNTVKLLVEFHKSSHRKDGRQGFCKICRKISDNSIYDKRYREANIDKISNYRESNRDKARNWRLCNLAKKASIQAKRRASQKNATPQWLTYNHMIQIDSFYEEANRLSKLGNGKFEVDHIMPLQGKNSCGLHVPWNLQIISAVENRKKFNKD